MTKGKTAPPSIWWLLGLSACILGLGGIIEGEIMYYGMLSEDIEPPPMHLKPAKRMLVRNLGPQVNGNASPLQVVRAVEQARKFPFQTMELMAGAQPYQMVGRDGTECVIHGADRGMLLSEHQINYPVPESGCGVTAVLDWMLWYQGTGLISRSNQYVDADLYKRRAFESIDRGIYQLRGRFRTAKDGPNTAELIIVFDGLVRQLSKGKIRLSPNTTMAPLSYQTLLDQTRGLRAGILVTRVYDGRKRGAPAGTYHAVALVRTDSTGRVSIGNWGDYQHGRLVMRADGQWFVPDNGAPTILKIDSLITLTPFRPYP